MQRAAGEQDKINVYSLQGARTKIDIELLMLTALANALPTPRARRRAFENTVLEQFEADLNRHYRVWSEAQDVRVRFTC